MSGNASGKRKAGGGRDGAMGEGAARKKREFVKKVVISAPMWDHESFEAKKRSQVDACASSDGKTSDVYRTWVALAKPYFNDTVYDSSTSSTPVDVNHAVAANLFNLLHVIYAEARRNLMDTDFFRFEAPGFDREHLPEPSMVIEVPLSIDEITTGALSTIRYCGNHQLRLHVWKRAYQEHLTLTHVQKLE